MRTRSDTYVAFDVIASLQIFSMIAANLTVTFNVLKALISIIVLHQQKSRQWRQSAQQAKYESNHDILWESRKLS